MKKQTVDPNRRCPKCGKAENQVNAGRNRSGTQRCTCKDCNYKYTLNGKSHEIPEEIRQKALRMYYSGVSDRGVAKAMGFSKSNVLNWIKKTESCVDKRENKH